MMTATKSVRVNATHGISTDERMERLKNLDLTNVRRKLMEPAPEGKGWNEQQALEAEKWYKRYVAAIICYPEATQHVPNGPIDVFWHQHILDTQAYGRDCQNVLGYFLHHYPYFGLNGDAVERDTSFDETNELYRTMYGEDCTELKHFVEKPTLLNRIKGFFSKKMVNCSACANVECTHSPEAVKHIETHREYGFKEFGVMASGCTGKGSGTGCRQGCKRG